MADVDIAEIPHPSGQVKFRYSRYLSADGKSWVRHGLFRAYHENGQVASEGNYVNGAEEGVWRDYHANGNLAAQGEYKNGKEVGVWRYWSEEGVPE